MAAGLASLLMKLQDREMIVPESAVAEIEPMAGLIVESHTEKWILGHKHWRNMRIPVVSFENLAGGSLKKHSEYAKIAIVNRTDAEQKLPFWGLLVQDEPESIKLQESDIEPIDEPLSEAELMAVEVKGKRTCIPNIALIEQRLNQQL